MAVRFMLSTPAPASPTGGLSQPDVGGGGGTGGVGGVGVGGGGGAIAAFTVYAATREELDAALTTRLGIRPVVAIGAWAVRDLCGIDRGVVARWTGTTLSIMPHAGPRIVRLLAMKMVEAGMVLEEGTGHRALGTGDKAQRAGHYPEARSDIEARVLDALARAASPLAVDLLLAQPERWAGECHGDPCHGFPPQAESRALRDTRLNRLVHPPLVAAIGPPNIGKSTLLNALAGRTVAVTADEPGTTRDHVGALLDLGGLVVRWMDAPGINIPLRSDPIPLRSPAEGVARRAGGGGGGEEGGVPSDADTISAAAQHAALAAAAHADMILLCGDARSGFVDLAALHAPGLASLPALRIGLRADLGLVPSAALCITALSAPPSSSLGPRPSSLSSLVSLIRDTLVPPADLADPRPWRFW